MLDTVRHVPPLVAWMVEQLFSPSAKKNMMVRLIFKLGFFLGLKQPMNDIFGHA